jgi:hypothetical protein
VRVITTFLSNFTPAFLCTLLTFGVVAALAGTLATRPLAPLLLAVGTATIWAWIHRHG